MTRTTKWDASEAIAENGLRCFTVFRVKAGRIDHRPERFGSYREAAALAKQLNRR